MINQILGKVIVEVISLACLIIYMWKYIFFVNKICGKNRLKSPFRNLTRNSKKRKIDNKSIKA